MNKIAEIFRHPIAKIISLLLIIWLLASIGIVFLEQGQDSGLDNLTNSFWWAIVTITTVGYGDYSPSSFLGRSLAIILMLSGIGLVVRLQHLAHHGFSSRQLIHRQLQGHPAWRVH